MRVQHMCIDYIHIALEVCKRYESHVTLVAQQGKVYLETRALVLVVQLCSAVLKHQTDTRRRNSKRLQRYAQRITMIHIVEIMHLQVITIASS